LGLFTQCRLTRHLDGLEPAYIASQVRLFTSAFFDSLNVRTVHLVDAVLPAELATARLADQISGIAVRPRPIQGVTFGVNKDENDLSRWDFFLEGGALPELNLSTYHGTHFRPPDEWLETVMGSGAVNALWFEGKGTRGSSESDVYLFCKRTALRRSLFLGVPDSAAAAAGSELRALCSSVHTSVAREQTGAFKLSRWWWRQKRFVRNFDQALLERAGAARMAAILTALGIGYEPWFSAAR
jgi:hypothetical protein